MRISDWSSDVCSSDLGLYRRMEVVELLNLNDLSDAADYWLEHTPGAAFRSSVGKTVQAGSAKNLTVIEKRDRKSVVKGKSVLVRVDNGGRRIMKKKEQRQERIISKKRKKKNKQ